MELTVPVDGGRLWADDTGGDGPVIVLLHAWWADSSSWLPVLGKLPPGYRVVRYDIRGYGRSPAPVAAFTQLGDLAAVLDDRGTDEVVLVGHSGAGGTAIGLALADPARVRGLLLLAPGVQDYPWPEDDPYGKRFGELWEAGDREGLTELGVRTWAAAGDGPEVREQIRGAADAFFRVGDSNGPTRPRTPGSARSARRPSWSPGTASTRWWRAARRRSPRASPAASRCPRPAPTTCCRCACLT